MNWSSPPASVPISRSSPSCGCGSSRRCRRQAPARAGASRRRMRDAAVARRSRISRLAARPMNRPRRQAAPGVAAHDAIGREESIRSLSGAPLIAVMCIGQLGNLLPHVTLSANLAQHLMPAWELSAADGGLMASGYAFGYMLAVPVLTTLTDRIDARLVLLCGSILSGLATVMFGLLAQGFWSATAIW